MKFVDEVVINVEAGKGGDGCLSFRREKYIAFGGPDGGNGGAGGSVFLNTSAQVNTLADYRHNRHHKARSGQGGMGKDRTGKQGEDLALIVPIGTLVYDDETNELIADLSQANQRTCVAQGGEPGFGNAHFKSSTNRAPRRITKGTPGDQRSLRLELQVLADVGLLGLPNAGKSTFIRAISAAKPKVADYPFTTLHPQLGVVQVSDTQSFVVADIPGLIAGAAQGHGLGFQFLRHVSRTRVLLHLVDLSGFEGQTPVEQIQVIEKELQHYDEVLMTKPRWLVFNKIDLMPEDDYVPACEAVIKEIQWKGSWFAISAATGRGTKELCQKVQEFIE